MDNSQESAAQGGPEQSRPKFAMKAMTSQNTSLGSGINIGGVISRTFETLMKNPVVFFGISFAVMVPPAILGALAPAGGALNVIVKIIEMILGCIAQGAIAYAVYQAMSGKIVGMGDALGRGTATIVPLVLTSILMTLGMMLGMLLLIVPGFILICMWFVAIPACVVEKTGPVESLQRSAFLTKGCRLQIFALVLLTFVLIAILVGAISFLIASITGSYVAAALVAAIIGIVPQAFASVLYAIVYYDLRALKEGISLDNLTSVFD